MATEEKLKPDKALKFSASITEAIVPVISRASPSTLRHYAGRTHCMAHAIQGMLQGMVPRYDLSDSLSTAPNKIRLINRTKLSLKNDLHTAVSVVCREGAYCMRVHFESDRKAPQQGTSVVEFPAPYRHVFGRRPFVVSLEWIQGLPGEMHVSDVACYSAALYIARFGALKIMPKHDGPQVSETEFELCLRCDGETYFAPVPPEVVALSLQDKPFCSLCGS